MRSIHLDPSVRSQPFAPITGLEGAVALDYDYVDKRIFFSQVKAHKLSQFRIESVALTNLDIHNNSRGDVIKFYFFLYYFIDNVCMNSIQISRSFSLSGLYNVSKLDWPLWTVLWSLVIIFDPNHTSLLLSRHSPSPLSSPFSFPCPLHCSLLFYVPLPLSPSSSAGFPATFPLFSFLLLAFPPNERRGRNRLSDPHSRILNERLFHSFGAATQKARYPISHLFLSPSDDGVAYDWITRKIYWSDANQHHIYSMNLDTTNRLTVALVEKPRAIVLDPCHGSVIPSLQCHCSRVTVSIVNTSSWLTLLLSSICERSSSKQMTIFSSNFLIAYNWISLGIFCESFWSLVKNIVLECQTSIVSATDLCPIVVSSTASSVCVSPRSQHQQPIVFTKFTRELLTNHYTITLIEH